MLVTACVSLRHIGAWFFGQRFQELIGHDQCPHRIACVTAASRDGLIGCGFKPIRLGAVLTRFLPQISLRNLRKLDCYANRYPLRSKTLYSP
jgi:hypothetical protein